MSAVSQSELLVVPDSLKKQLKTFRSRVWSTKMLEALVLGALGVLLAFLTVYFVDRILDTPREARFAIFVASLLLWLAVPIAFRKWVWNNRRLDQLARLLRVKEPSVGDQLLSVIELAENRSEQSRSKTLCAAAIAQVADVAAKKDFSKAAPGSFLAALFWALVGAAIVSGALSIVFPEAAANAWTRYLSPWKPTPRYTFTSITPLPPEVVVPHGEIVTFGIALSDESQWRPESAQLRVGNDSYMKSDMVQGAYQFELPPQLTTTTLKALVGDYYQTVKLEPVLRPELVGAVAQVVLPEYLQRSEGIEQDVRSGSLTVVSGSTAVINATASRELDKAIVDDHSVAVENDTFQTEQFTVAGEPSLMTMRWSDGYGLGGKEAFELEVTPLEDESPTVVSQDLAKQAVILDVEQLNFQALAADDFGIKKIGMVWRSLEEDIENPAQGEKVLAAGGATSTSMQVPAIFCAATLGITPQAIEFQLWAEDYLPGRERVYSAPHTFYVLDAQQHAMWISGQLSKWHRASLDVRDKELQLHASNKQLRQRANDQGSEGQDAGENLQADLRRQAALEVSNSRRLKSLSKAGEDLLRQAARNPEMGANQLESWAEMLQVLNDIGKNRMPSVSDLLSKAAKEQVAGKGKPNKPGAPMAGKIRASATNAGGKEEQEANKPDDQPTLPSIQDVESSMQGAEENQAENEKKKKDSKPSAPRLSLPKTTLLGPPPEPGEDVDDEEEDAAEPEEDSLDKALFEQEELLAEFEKISDELNELLANLEGSTLVKRLKAESRQQELVATEIGLKISSFFGSRDNKSQDLKKLYELKEAEEESSKTVSYIMDDMQSFYERRRKPEFKLILDEMRELDVLVALREVGESITKSQGMSIAQAEFWADSLDRWAEDLVPPADPSSGKSLPGKADAMPPALILEVLKVLEGEVNLRESTRVADQARPAVDEETHLQEAERLSIEQSVLQERTNGIVMSLTNLPEGRTRFPKEMALLTAVGTIMNEASQLLAGGETGSPAIAAETEAIELLLQANRANPNASGGGSGATPGGGGTGDTQDSALALLGSGLNQNERREAREVTQATGETGRVLPEEFRAGLDKYFEMIEDSL